jgi:hypothetical protein
VHNLGSSTTAELEAKAADLSKKYFMTHNTELKSQIVAILETYKDEIASRRQAEFNALMAKSEKGLDKLINID